MGFLTYTAIDRGRLVSGHSEGTQYSIELGINKFTPSAEVFRKTHPSLDRSNVVTIRHGKDHFAEVSTVAIRDLDIVRQLYEFEDSVDGNQTFEIDPYGSILTPAETYVATLESMLKPQRVGRMEVWRFSFRIKFDPSQTVYS